MSTTDGIARNIATTLRTLQEENANLHAGYEAARMEIESLKAQLEALAAPAQLVAHVSQETFNDDGTSDIIIPALPIGMALYAAPQPATQAAPTFAAKLPSPANVGTAPKCLDFNDQAMWVLGWNECLDAAIAAQQGDKP